MSLLVHSSPCVRMKSPGCGASAVTSTVSPLCSKPLAQSPGATCSTFPRRGGCIAIVGGYRWRWERSVAGGEQLCRIGFQRNDVHRAQRPRIEDRDRVLLPGQRDVELIAVRRDRDVRDRADERLGGGDALGAEVDRDDALVRGHIQEV